jgi:hypothetical protein
MKEIIEEYGGVLLAMVGSLAVIGITCGLFFDKISQQVILYVATL